MFDLNAEYLNHHGRISAFAHVIAGEKFAMKIVFRICLLVSTGLFFQTSAAEPNAGALPEIKLQRYGGMMVLPLQINGKSCSLMVDTGAVATCLRDTAAKELGVVLKTEAGVGGESGIKTGKITAKVPGQNAVAFPGLSGTHPFIPLPAVETLPGAVGGWD